MRKFKNDIERKQFLDDYRNEQNGWFLWKNDDDLDPFILYFAEAAQTIPNRVMKRILLRICSDDHTE